MSHDIQQKNHHMILIQPKKIESIPAQGRAGEIPPVSSNRIEQIDGKLGPHVGRRIGELCADHLLAELKRLQSIETLPALQKH